ncbi:MAG: baseplate J/gp47 family protein [Bradymonadaceae bacterium]
MADEPAGLTDEGYTAPRTRAYLDFIRAEFEARTGKSPDWSFDTFYGQITAVMAARLGEASQTLQEIYDARDPNNATGVQLDQLVAFAGITRQGATRGLSVQELDGDINTGVPEGRLVVGGGDGKVEWALTRDVRIGWAIGVDTVTAGEDYTVTIDSTDFTYTAKSGDTDTDILQSLANQIQGHSGTADKAKAYVYATRGSADDRLTIEPELASVSVSVSATGTAAFTKTDGRSYVLAEAETPGNIEAGVGEISTIGTPVSGWNSTTNRKKADPGRDRESDHELRLRWFESLNAAGNSTKGAIRAEVLELEFIESAVVVENDQPTEQTIEGITLDPKSLSVVVYPSTLTDDQKKDVARAIYRTAPIGIETIGTDVQATVEGDDGYDKSVHFNTANKTVIDVRTTVTLKQGYDLGDVEATIRSAIESYVSDDLALSDDVRRLPMFGAIDEIGGVDSVQKLELRFDGGTYSESDLSLGALEFAAIDQNVVQT